MGSNHYSLKVDTEDERLKQAKQFRFEVAWLTQEGFREKLKEKWPVRGGLEIQDYWRHIKSEIRKFYRGWGANLSSQMKKDKEDLKFKIRKLDEGADLGILTPAQWKERYQLEEEQEKIYSYEEIQWKKMSGEKWIPKGDANNGFFHNIANGRKKKCTIFSLEDEGREIRDPKGLREHIQRYYKDLFGSEDSGTIHLSENIWSLHGSLSGAEAQDLVKLFTIPKLECASVDMDASSAPHPDGLSVGFYREFSSKVKDVMLEMFRKLFEGSLNLSRLNYGLISLIPKLKEPNTIK